VAIATLADLLPAAFRYPLKNIKMYSSYPEGTGKKIIMNLKL
jgi:hypothetical protein